VTVEGSGIESIEDIKGKAVSVGDQNSGVELNAKTVVDAYGLSYDDFDADYLPYAEAIDQMRNGQLDAAFVTSGLPNSAVTDLATSDDVAVVPFTGEGRDKLLSEHDYFGEGEVPAGTYGDNEAAETLTIPNLLVVSPSLSDDAVYDVTKSLFDNLDQIQGSHNAAKDITVASAQDVPVGEVAPGAKTYFDEQGSALRSPTRRAAMTSALPARLRPAVPLSAPGPGRQRLVIREQAPSRRIFRSVPISDDDVVAMTWMHSVDKTPWWEYYSPVDGELVLDCTELALMGAGTPFDA